MEMKKEPSMIPRFGQVGGTTLGRKHGRMEHFSRGEMLSSSLDVLSLKCLWDI